MVHGYSGLLKRLGRLLDSPIDDGTPARRDLDATVVGIGYDFRRGVVRAAAHVDGEIRARVAHLWPGEQDPADRVVIVAHSMGGLVARYWIAQHGGAHACRCLITLGTPHRGAPKALEILANGAPVGRFHVRRPREVLREWEGVAELLPRYPAVQDLTAGTGQPVLRHPHELPVPWLTEGARQAFAVHERIRTGWAAIETRPALYPRIGFSHRTLRSSTWDGQRFRVVDEAPPGADGGGWGEALGDGTVPALSGQPLELDKQPRHGLTVASKHGPIVELAEVDAIVASLLSDASLAPFHGAEVSAALSLDVDDLQVAGKAFGVRGAVRSPQGPLPVDADLATAWLTVTPVSDGTAAATHPVVDEQVAWDADAGTWEHDVPGLAPGLYEVTLAAEAVAGGLQSTQTIEVLDDAGLE